MKDADKLFEAITRGDGTTMRSALAADPTLVQARNAAGVSAVLAALYHRKKDLLDVLLEANPTLAKAWSGDGFTALHLACFFGHVDAARLLLDGGADADAQQEGGWTALHAAVRSGHAEMVGENADPTIVRLLRR